MPVDCIKNDSPLAFSSSALDFVMGSFWTNLRS